MDQKTPPHAPLDFVEFPVTFTYYTHHSWLIGAAAEFNIYGLTPKEIAETNLLWDTYYSQLETAMKALKERSVGDLVSKLVDTAPPSIDYIETDISYFKSSYIKLEDYILDNCTDFARDWDSLSHDDMTEWNKVFDSFYESSWDPSPYFKQAVRSFCLGMYSSSSIHSWASLCPQKLTLVYTLSDYFDDDYANHEHHWLAYDGGNSYVCTSCGEKKEVVPTY